MAASPSQQQIQVEALVRRHARLSRDVVAEAIEGVRDTINLGQLEASVVAQSIPAAESVVAIDKIAERMAPIEVRITEAVADGGKLAAAHAPLITPGVVFELDVLSPLIIEHIRQRSADLVREVSRNTVAGLRRVLDDAFRSGLPPRRAAMRIRSMVGMTERMAAANERFRQDLIGREFAPARVDKLTRSHAERTVRRRADTIARTEMLDAASVGRQQMWEQAANSGAMREDRVERQWLTAKDERVDCKVCKPMDRQRRGLREPFLTGDGRAVMQPGISIHPNDRCTVIIRPARRRRR